MSQHLMGSWNIISCHKHMTQMYFVFNDEGQEDCLLLSSVQNITHSWYIGIQSTSTNKKMALAPSLQLLLNSTNRLHSAVTLMPISFCSKWLELCVTLQWFCFWQIKALEAESTSSYSTVDWTTSALWSLVRDSSHVIVVCTQSCQPYFTAEWADCSHSWQ